MTDASPWAGGGSTGLCRDLSEVNLTPQTSETLTEILCDSESPVKTATFTDWSVSLKLCSDWLKTATFTRK